MAQCIVAKILGFDVVETSRRVAWPRPTQPGLAFGAKTSVYLAVTRVTKNDERPGGPEQK